MYHADEEHNNNLFHKLYSEIMLARDLCQYGHIDEFCLERIVEERNKIQPKKKE